eukprot:765470-Hanusia_phi.AAC.5
MTLLNLAHAREGDNRSSCHADVQRLFMLALLPRPVRHHHLLGAHRLDDAVGGEGLEVLTLLDPELSCVVGGVGHVERLGDDGLHAGRGEGEADTRLGHVEHDRDSLCADGDVVLVVLVDEVAELGADVCLALKVDGDVEACGGGGRDHLTGRAGATESAVAARVDSDEDGARSVIGHEERLGHLGLNADRPEVHAGRKRADGEDVLGLEVRLAVDLLLLAGGSGLELLRDESVLVERMGPGLQDGALEGLLAQEQPLLLLGHLQLRLLEGEMCGDPRHGQAEHAHVLGGLLVVGVAEGRGRVLAAESKLVALGQSLDPHALRVGQLQEVRVALLVRPDLLERLGVVRQVGRALVVVGRVLLPEQLPGELLPVRLDLVRVIRMLEVKLGSEVCVGRKNTSRIFLLAPDLIAPSRDSQLSALNNLLRSSFERHDKRAPVPTELVRGEGDDKFHRLHGQEGPGGRAALEVGDPGEGKVNGHFVVLVLDGGGELAGRAGRGVEEGEVVVRQRDRGLERAAQHLDARADHVTCRPPLEGEHRLVLLAVRQGEQLGLETLLVGDGRGAEDSNANLRVCRPVVQDQHLEVSPLAAVERAELEQVDPAGAILRQDLDGVLRDQRVDVQYPPGGLTVNVEPQDVSQQTSVVGLQRDLDAQAAVFRAGCSEATDHGLDGEAEARVRGLLACEETYLRSASATSSKSAAFEPWLQMSTYLMVCEPGDTAGLSARRGRSAGVT